ncbi:MAG: hypothetical protein HKO62_11275 [Gammaproteobacteria bacterium]|nr:hypothetical protein [Gammaproteobacteria bacterium]NNM01323.1 hypothetical protein [Gammaproteobacteria bacterium]
MTTRGSSARCRFHHGLAVLLVTLLAALAGCGVESGGYYPLEAGRWWQYATTVTILDEPRTQKTIISNFANGTLEGRPVTVRRIQAGELHYLHQGDAGIQRIARRLPGALDLTSEDPPMLLFPAEPAGVVPWQVKSRLSLVESRTFARADRVIVRRIPVELTAEVTALDAEVRVPAGRFRDCVLITSRGSSFVKTDRGNAVAEVFVEQQDWFAPEVGLVRSERSESTDSVFLKPGHYVQELEQYR